MRLRLVIKVSLALLLLNHQRFEAIVVDLELGQANEVLEHVRLSQSNRTVVTFAITDPQKPASLKIQPHFAMERPLSASSVGRALKAAFGLIVRERLRSFRCPVTIPAVILTNGEEASCRLVNISEGGMARTAPLPAARGQVGVLFTLPGQRNRFTVDSEVCWYDENGHAGLRSLLISAEERSVLQEWLAAKLEEDLPEAVASQFRQNEPTWHDGGRSTGEFA